MSGSMKSISLEDYKYELPEEKIAKQPLKNRSDSKLLMYKSGEISHKNFIDLIPNLPDSAHLVFNDTRVIPARLHFTKDTGALIEIFLLEPIEPVNEVASAMLVKESCKWKCMIGNLKKWRDNQLLSLNLNNGLTLQANISDRQKQIVEFSWDQPIEFVHVVEAAGKIPLPPYIDREVTFEDHERYQTVYSHHDGAVAAPTAGLHFDQSILDKLSGRLDYVTLHVSAGTFQPIKVENAIEHNMHSEQIIVTRRTLLNVFEKDYITAVGTTSMRTLESLYWYGVKLINGKTEFKIEKLYPYQHQEHNLPSKKESISAILNFMDQHDLEVIHGITEIFIFPGYLFRVCKALITNFHLPGSTLILLVAAFIGEAWRDVYKEAIANDYRFLSYGDSSLLIP